VVALATVADLEARLGRALTDAEAPRADALLADASSKVRGFTHQVFDQVLGDEVVLRPVGTVLRLPQRPVLDVTAVVALGCADLPEVALTGWCWDGADKVDVAARRPVDAGVTDWWWQRCGNPDTYRVTYDHGYAVAPPDVVAVVCAMVNRTLTSPTMVEGLTSERIGQYGYQFAQFSGGQSPGPNVRLSEADKQDLIDAGYRRRSTTVQTSAR